MTPKLRMPGATLTTRLKVYASAAPDGQIGGTPHMHQCCTEMYFVIGGSGAVEVLDMNGFSRVELPLHAAYTFTPGTIHRLINSNKNLELFIVMQNSGLPERGDNLVTFENEIMQSDEKFRAIMKIENEADAFRRRDAGVRGFLQLKEAFARGLEEGRAALRRFYQLGAERTAARRAEWREKVREGALFEAQRSLQMLDDLDRGDIGYLTGSAQHLVLPGKHKTLGFCGHLDRYFDPANLPG